MLRDHYGDFDEPARRCGHQAAITAKLATVTG
jgi:hypothetical protein